MPLFGAPPTTGGADNWGSRCSSQSFLPTLPTTREAVAAVSDVFQLCRQLGELSQTTGGAISVVAHSERVPDDWVSRCSRCRLFCPHQRLGRQKTWEAVAAVRAIFLLCRQLEPTTGQTVAAVRALFQPQGVPLQQFSFFSYSAYNWG